MPSGSLNIAEWSPDQVAEWMSGLEPTVAQYVPALKERGLNGAKLLTLRCDDLEYLGIHIIGHQELLLEAVEHLRNFQYEISRECVQQLALRVSAAAAALARALRHHTDARLETHSLADVARTVHAVKPLVCWLDRWPLCSGAPLADRKAALLKLSLEAATCAQRDRFAEQPARAVAAAAAAAANVADYIIQEVSDPLILQPASLEAVSLAQGDRALGFTVRASCCGHRQLARVRFGSPAHASGRVHEGDEIVQVGSRCVIGWSGEAVEAACLEAARAGGELALRLRRRGARALPTPPLLARAQPPRARLRLPPLLTQLRFQRYEYDFPCAHPGSRGAEVLPGGRGATVSVTGDGTDTGGGGEPAASSSDESEPLSPPASPTQLHLDRRLYPPKPAAAALRRHTVCGGSPIAKRAPLTIDQFWQELQERRAVRGASPERGDGALYRRDKAVSCSTGLQLSPRPRTCLGVPRNSPCSPAPPVPTAPRTPSPARGKLDKSHSTPAYDFDADPEPVTAPFPPALATQPIPESPTTPPAPVPATAPGLSPIPATALTPAPPYPCIEKTGEQTRNSMNGSSQIGEDIPYQWPKGAVADEELRKGDSGWDVAGSDSTKDAEVPLHQDLEDILPIDEEPCELVESVNPILVGGDVKRATPDSDSAVSPKIVVDDIVEEAKTIPIRFPKPRLAERWKPSDVPPEPPPRPASTQRMGRDYVRDPHTPTRDFMTIADPLSPVREPMSPSRDFVPVPREVLIPQYPALRMLPRPAEIRELTPLKPIRHGDTTQISVPLRHITKHDIKLIANERREMPPINGEPEMSNRREDTESTSALPQPPSTCQPTSSAAMSPTGSVVRGIFPTSKSRGLKKKNSILAKRRDIPARTLIARGAVGGTAGGAAGAGGAGGAVWQRVRARHAQQPRWARRHLLLVHNLLYAYKTPDCSRADCMIHLEGFTVCAAGEVRSRAHAFKVYHTGTAFYFATDCRDHMLTWIHLIHRATLTTEPRQMELAKQFSETDYSDSDSDNDSLDKRCEREREREKDKDKDKSKFGSLKKLTHRMQRSESQENVSHSSTSLDRKYLRFFSRNKSKDESKAKSKQSGVPVPSEHYRSYRRVTQLAPAPGTAPAFEPAVPGVRDARASKRIPKPINYIHASNPNLLDFEKSEYNVANITKPTFPIPKPKVRQVENLTGFVTLEEFMLKKQEEERRQVYTNRVLMGIERDKKEDMKAALAAKELQKRLDRIVPDVIYGALPGDTALADLQARSLPRTPEQRDNPTLLAPSAPPERSPRPRDKPISVKGKDGYEKIVYPEERAGAGAAAEWRDSLRRNDKVHSGVSSAAHAHLAHQTLAGDSWNIGSNGAGAAGATGGTGGAGVSRLRQMFGGGRRDLARQDSKGCGQYPHLQCPPTFQPETYSLARLAPRRDRPDS